MSWKDEFGNRRGEDEEYGSPDILGESREPEKPISLQPISDETKKFVALAEKALGQKDWDADVQSPLDVEPSPQICAICQKSCHPHHTRGWAGHKFVALAESSLSSEPSKEELEAATEKLAGMYGEIIANAAKQVFGNDAASPELLPIQPDKEKDKE